MSLSRNEFEVLQTLCQSAMTPSANDLDKLTGLAPHEVDQAWDTLLEQGFITAYGHITHQGTEALEPFRVKNAVIQAAGTCSRFSPLSYDIPKGLLKVQGERMIERMIRQLHEAGIYDITMVVGHKKEMYTYLGAKYGVTFVENPDYAITNTCRSLWCAREHLSRTYLLFSDTYFVESPFNRYVWEGYYSTRPVEGHTDEWLFVSGPDGYINDMIQGGDEGEYMGGYAVLDETIVSQLLPILDAVQGDEEAMNQYWETMWYRNFDKVHIRSKCVSEEFLEFDSMDDLQAYDPTYLDKVVSPSLDFICSVLRCSREEIHDCYPLTKGLTNLTCHFAVGAREYVFRVPVGLDGREQDFINETQVEEAAYKLGFNRAYVHEDPTSGKKISRFIPNAVTMDQGFEGDPRREQAVRILAQVHTAKDIRSQVFCNRWEEVLQHEAVLREHNIEMDEEYQDFHRRVERLYELASAEDFPVSFSHNDCWFGNFLVGEGGALFLIDWENAGMADEASDFAFFAALCFCTRAEFDELLEVYLGRKPTELEYRHFAAHFMIAGLWQYSWGLYTVTRPNFVVDWPIDEWVAGERQFMLDHLDWVEELYQ